MNWKDKRLWIGIVIIIVILIGAWFVLNKEAEFILDEKYCELDSDCIFHCPKGCINKKFYSEPTALCKVAAGECKCIDNSCDFVLQ